MSKRKTATVTVTNVASTRVHSIDHYDDKRYYTELRRTGSVVAVAAALGVGANNLRGRIHDRVDLWNNGKPIMVDGGTVIVSPSSGRRFRVYTSGGHVRMDLLPHWSKLADRLDDHAGTSRRATGTEMTDDETDEFIASLESVES